MGLNDTPHVPAGGFWRALGRLLRAGLEVRSTRFRAAPQAPDRARPASRPARPH